MLVFIAAKPDVFKKYSSTKNESMINLSDGRIMFHKERQKYFTSPDYEDMYNDSEVEALKEDQWKALIIKDENE